MTIQELKNKWNKEKEAYKNQEVGCGVQIFVKDILQSEDIFVLRRGLKSTPLEKRKNEFLEEEKTKAQRTADIIIYISPEIVIPLEVERHQNIEAGKQQLLNYKADIGKKYGILTDGFTWRFYTDNIFREFNLNQILDETEFFLEFWKEYVKPENYYLLFFEHFGQLPLIKQETLPVEQNRQMFFEDITKLIRGFKHKLNIEGYLINLDKKVKEKTAIELTYAYIIQFILYKTLVDNEFREFKKEFENIVKTIHKNLKEKRYKEILGIIDDISDKISKNIYRPFSKEQELINQKFLELYRSLKNSLSDVSPWLEIFFFIKKYNFANIENEIFGYIYENYLKELYEEVKKGQYFTDPAVVNFMLKQIGYSPENIKKRLDHKPEENYISIIDPACGSGTFLYSAVNQIIDAIPNGSENSSKEIEELVNNNVFGLDIAEFPLYLAEMNIIMRMLPIIITEKYNNPVDKKIKVFLTKDSISEFLDTELRHTGSGLIPLNFSRELEFGYESYVREKADLKEMKKSVEGASKMPRRRFDYVIANPPYVGYNECSKQKVQIFEYLRQRRESLSNIYGVNLHSIPSNPKKYAPKPNLYAFFIALGIALLKNEGRLCYIVPQTMLTAGDLDVLRYHLAKETTIEKIITFPNPLFIGRGFKQKSKVATSSLIFILNNKKPSAIQKVEIINYQSPDDNMDDTFKNILAGEKIDKKEILQETLFQNVVNWNFIKQSKKFLDFYKEYRRNTQDISIYYEHILAEQKFRNRFYFDKGLVFPKSAIKEKLSDKAKDFFDLMGLEKNRYSANTVGQIVEKEDIKIPHGSQGFEVFTKRYKIIWSYMNYDHFYFSDKNIMINFNFVIISSDNKNELLYLLSLLNSPVTHSIIEKNLRTETEKDILIGIKTIKKFVRVPKITEDNQQIKDEIIKRTEEMLELEETKLSDFVDFSKVMLQKFNRVSVEGNDLILEKDDEKIKLTIRENQSLVKKSLNERCGRQIIELEKQKIGLSELKDLPIIDYEKQQKIKDYIDDLVFVLYFDIKIPAFGINKAKRIKSICKKNKFYRILNE